ncbi:hypothetical protein ACSSVY_004007 [Roseovarius sp. MBR-51]
MQRGIRVGTRRDVSQKELTRLVEEGTGEISCQTIITLSDMASELTVTNDRDAAIVAEIRVLTRTDADLQRLMDMHDIDPSLASALVGQN